MRMSKLQITELEREDEKPFFKKEILSFTKEILCFKWLSSNSKSKEKVGD